MNRNRKTFLLVGNRPYANRGCEAIVRSTVDMVSEVYPEARFILSSFGGQPAIEDGKKERDRRISHRPDTDQWYRRFGRDWWRYRVVHRYSSAWQENTRFRVQFSTAQTAACALQIGGDNYSLEYGKPLLHMFLDRCLKSTGIPLVLWGASVGPFTSDPEFERAMCNHLGLFGLILARETETVSYLASIGIEDNVRLVADPAFVLVPEKPTGDDELSRFLELSPVGLNFSPLVGNYADDGGMGWPGLAKKCLEALIEADFGPLLLVPHVMEEGNDDYAFLTEIARDVAGAGVRYMIAPRGLTAAEYKWVISRLRAFVGARTHATIAALSSGVPTVSIGYSMKARGINKDIFGHTDWVLPIKDFSPQVLVERCRMLLDQRDSVSSHLARTIPNVVASARSAAAHLSEVMEHR